MTKKITFMLKIKSGFNFFKLVKKLYYISFCYRHKYNDSTLIIQTFFVLILDYLS